MIFTRCASACIVLLQLANLLGQLFDGLVCHGVNGIASYRQLTCFPQRHYLSHGLRKQTKSLAALDSLFGPQLRHPLTKYLDPQQS